MTNKRKSPFGSRSDQARQAEAQAWASRRLSGAACSPPPPEPRSRYFLWRPPRRRRRSTRPGVPQDRVTQIPVPRFLLSPPLSQDTDVLRRGGGRSLLNVQKEFSIHCPSNCFSLIVAPYRQFLTFYNPWLTFAGGMLEKVGYSHAIANAGGLERT